MFCREQVARLLARRADIESRGAGLLAVGNGSLHFAQAFREDMHVDFPLYTDPSRQAFRALGFRRDRLALARPSVWRHVARATAAGHTQTSIEGDPWQNGGVAVIWPGGDVRYLHIEDEAGDLCDLDAVVRALGR